MPERGAAVLSITAGKGASLRALKLVESDNPRVVCSFQCYVETMHKVHCAVLTIASESLTSDVEEAEATV